MFYMVPSFVFLFFVCFSFEIWPTLQMTGIVVGDVVELGFLVAPVEIWRPIAEAILHRQWFVVFHVVHQVKVAHLVIVGRTARK